MSLTAANSNEASPSAKRLLAVDDSSESAELIARIGTGCGYETKPVMDPRCVPQILEDWKPDVLTLDLCMPHRDGFSILASLQEVGFKGSLVIISAQNDWLRKAACQLAEVNGIEVTSHLEKPINLRALRDLLNTLRLVG
ncbi:MAG TPA: response regulator [Micropepsaceae bacterium]|nr:response regulator [Micropepsaceae bacterium]